MLAHWRLPVLLMLSVAAEGQWLNYPTPGVPRTADGKPNLAAPAPRAANGKPDLSGVWLHEPTPPAELKRLFGDHAGDVNVPGMEIETVSKYGINILVNFKSEEVSMRPAAAEIFRRRATGAESRSPCLPVGFPAAGFLSEPFKIVQSPRLTAVLYEDTHRQIYIDGRMFPKEFAQPSWLGYSIGHWEGDTLVVETAGFNVGPGWMSAAIRIARRCAYRNAITAATLDTWKRK